MSSDVLPSSLNDNLSSTLQEKCYWTTTFTQKYKATTVPNDWSQSVNYSSIQCGLELLQWCQSVWSRRVVPCANEPLMMTEQCVCTAFFKLAIYQMSDCDWRLSRQKRRKVVYNGSLPLARSTCRHWPGWSITRDHSSVTVTPTPSRVEKSR